MSIKPNAYRTHACGELRGDQIDQRIRVSGWVETIRDHGGILFIDLRDHYGVLQIVVHDDTLLKGVHRETVIMAEGILRARSEDTVNPKLATGAVELLVDRLEVLGKSMANLPFDVTSSTDTREEVRLKYRYLDLRNPAVQKNILLRARVISRMRRLMEERGFVEIQTPILTCSSPEGARDYLVPSRKYHGKFYALPQAPQIFKQLLMVSGFDRYFQIAPCFRDEDARADRSPGEFYQLDFEMAFATQEEVFEVGEEVLYQIFAEFSDAEITKPPFPRISYREAMAKYGTDKPDLRNPLTICDLSDIFKEADFPAFRGKPVRGIYVDGAANNPRSFFENMLTFATEIGMKGLGYIKMDEEGSYLGPIGKFIPESQRENLNRISGLKPGGVLFFISAAKDLETSLFAGQIRTELAARLDLLEKNAFCFCYVCDFPMYELDERGNPAFTHNPFSMPQGGLEALNTKNPLEILAYQYDIVCNGVELSSGAVRNHDPEIMERAFEIAGYSKEELKAKFSALYDAFHYGAPPHAGMAPGVDRLLMLLTGHQNIREVIAFPMNAAAQDVMLGAPSEVTEQQLRDVHIKIR